MFPYSKEHRNPHFFSYLETCKGSQLGVHLLKKSFLVLGNGDKEAAGMVPTWDVVVLARGSAHGSYTAMGTW